MRFLYLCTDQGIPVLGHKGASVHLRELANALMNQGHVVNIVCATRGAGNEIGNLSVTEIEPLPESTASPNNPPAATVRDSLTPQHPNDRVIREFRTVAYDAHAQRALESLLAETKPDVLYERYALFGHAGTRVALKYQLPHVLEVNAPLIQEVQSTKGLRLLQLAQQTEDTVFRSSDSVIAVSAVLRDYVIERGASPSRVTVIPNGVDIARFTPAIGNLGRDSTITEALGLRADLRQRVVVGFVGSLKPWHGVETVIDACARLQHTDPFLYLLIVGDGPQGKSLAARARALGLSDRIHFTGAVPHTSVPKYVALMDITVAPYRHHANYYLSPLKLVEYMAMGKPVVASRQGQIAELIEHGRNGLLYDPDSVADFSKALIRLARDSDLRRRLGRNAAELVARTRSWSFVARRIAVIVEALL